MAKTVLIIDDSRSIRSILVNALRGQNLFDHYLEATDGRKGLILTAEHDVDIVLCDLDMPELDGFGFLDGFRAEPQNQNIPVLMLSGNDTSDKKVEGFARGANDYIVKPCGADELCARVKNYLRLKLLQDELAEKYRELHQKNEELANLAITDALTGLHNRRHFMARAEEELTRAERYRHGVGVLMLDIDHFKRINDTKGHHQGDVVLIETAEVLRRSLRTTDLLARLGGEEFAVLLPEIAPDQVVIVAEKLREAIASRSFTGMDWQVTVSVGSSGFPWCGARAIEKLLALADHALYAAKQGGRNRVHAAPRVET